MEFHPPQRRGGTCGVNQCRNILPTERASGFGAAARPAGPTVLRVRLASCLEACRIGEISIRRHAAVLSTILTVGMIVPREGMRYSPPAEHLAWWSFRLPFTQTAPVSSLYQMY